MIPILYPPTENEFNSNGIGLVSDAISCIVIEERNGIFELEMRYPVMGLRFADIVGRSLILAKPNPEDAPQPFRVYRITKPMNGVVSIFARHICYDLEGIPVTPFSAASIADAFAKMKANAVIDCPFEFWTDKSTAAPMTIMAPQKIWYMLKGNEGGILDVYGGEYKFDRYKVKLYNTRGYDRGVTIRYGKNLLDLEQEENCAAICTGIYPYWLDSEGKIVQLEEMIVKVPGTFDFSKILPLDLTGEFETEPTKAQLKARTERYIRENNVGVPRVSLRFSFAQLEQTDEYKHLKQLEQVDLCDTVTVVFERLGVHATAKVIRTVYDCLRNRYQSVEIGDARSSFADTIVSQGQELKNKPAETVVRAAIMQMTAAILGAKGGAVRVLDTDGDKIPDTFYVADNPDPTQAVKVWRWNYMGWGASRNGYNGPFVMGATLEDGLLAEAVTAAKLVAGTIQSADGETFFLDLDNGILRMKSSSTTIDGKSVASKNDVDNAVNNLQIGGRNLFLNSGEEQKSAVYKVAQYVPSSPLVEGDTYTFTVCLTPAAGVVDLNLQSGRGMCSNCILPVTGADKQIVSGTVKMIYRNGYRPSDDIENANITIYRRPNDGTVTGETVVHWVKVEKGNKSTDWTPAPEDLQEEITKNRAELNVEIDGIKARAESSQETLNQMESRLATAQLTAEGARIEVEKIRQDGVDKVTTKTGYTFGDDGLRIEKQGEEMTSKFDHTGFVVRRSGDALLQIDFNGVNAKDVTVRNYLIIGEHARFEDYSDGTDDKRTACFWI